MAKDDFYIVNTWMIDELQLSGIELQCFAIIWSLSRGERQMYIAGNSFLVKMTKKTEQTIISTLKKLCGKGLIKKVPVIVNKVERNYYKAISQGDNKFEVGGSNNLSGGAQKILAPNNESNNESNNKEKRLSNDNQKNEEYSDDFLRFWKAYGYSRDKGTTYKRWNKLSEKDKKAALAALPAYFADCERCKRDKRYPAVYLNKRTWEDDFTSPEDKEEKEESPAVDEAEMEQWGKTKNWLYFNAPRIAGHISYEDFKEMKRVAKNKPDVVADIIKAIDQSYYNGNILSEFCSLAREEGYRNRIEA